MNRIIPTTLTTLALVAVTAPAYASPTATPTTTSTPTTKVKTTAKPIASPKAAEPTPTVKTDTGKTITVTWGMPGSPTVDSPVSYPQYRAIKCEPGQVGYRTQTDTYHYGTEAERQRVRQILSDGRLDDWEDTDVYVPGSATFGYKTCDSKPMRTPTRPNATVRPTNSAPSSEPTVSDTPEPTASVTPKPTSAPGEPAPTHTPASTQSETPIEPASTTHPTPSSTQSAMNPTKIPTATATRPNAKVLPLPVPAPAAPPTGNNSAVPNTEGSGSSQALPAGVPAASPINPDQPVTQPSATGGLAKTGF